MPKYYGKTPAPASQKAVEAFENEVVVQRNNQRLLGKVYVDLDEASWSLAVAYNVSQKRSIRGRDNQVQMRYTYVPTSDGHVVLTCTDPFAESTLDGGPFQDPDAFIRFALDHERQAASAPGAW